VFSAPYVPFIATLCAENLPAGSRLFLGKTRLYPQFVEGKHHIEGKTERTIDISWR
jgi:hypothetical protein